MALSDTVASGKADEGKPPMLSASAAFNAYGTLTMSTRGNAASFRQMESDFQPAWFAGGKELRRHAFVPGGAEQHGATAMRSAQSCLI
jgi:hypothetical protein